MANIITGIRIVISAFLLFCPVFSPEFFMLYISAGASDMIDGAVARKTGTVSEFLPDKSDSGIRCSGLALYMDYHHRIY